MTSAVPRSPFLMDRQMLLNVNCLCYETFPSPVNVGFFIHRNLHVESHRLVTEASKLADSDTLLAAHI